MSGEKNKKKSSPPDPRSRRYTAEQKRKAMELVASGMKQAEVARGLGTTKESIRRWKRAAENMALPKGAEDPGPAPVLSPGGLSQVEADAILEMKKKHPSYGPAQVQAQLRRFKGWQMSRKAIARVFRDNGYELVHVASRPKGDEESHRFEAARRNALWQMDLTDLRVGPEKRALATVLDDFSRFVVGWRTYESPRGEDMVDVLTEAIGKHGKPEALYTDRAGVFLDWGRQTSLQRFLDEQLIDHVVARAYHPQGRGKIEALFKSLRRELWDVRHFDSWDEAHEALTRWFRDYNERRAHMGIDGLTPADRFHGRWEQVRARVEAAARGRLAPGSDDSCIFEEGAGCGAPVDVVRLVVVDGRMELRLLGHKVVLGELDV